MLNCLSKNEESFMLVVVPAQTMTEKKETNAANFPCSTAQPGFEMFEMCFVTVKLLENLLVELDDINKHSYLLFIMFLSRRMECFIKMTTTLETQIHI